MQKKIAKILRGQITASVLYILFGLCLVLMPVETVDILCKVVFGVAMIIAGAYHVFVYAAEQENSTVFDLFSGVIVLVLGGFLFTNPQIVVKLLPLLLGAFVLVDSIWTLRGAFRLKKRKRESWKIFLIVSLIFIALGCAAALWKFETVNVMLLFSGCVILANGLVDMVLYVVLYRGMKAADQAENSKVSEPVSVPENVPVEVPVNDSDTVVNSKYEEDVLEEWKG